MCPASFNDAVLPPTVNLDEIAGANDVHPFSIVNWRSRSQVATLIEPVDAGKNIFQEDKTYWLVGLAGDLGQSICDWMAYPGARCIVLTSRNRRVEDNWINKHKENGVTISWLAG
jgi:hybrid polyketide synthase/nonribosomal peptide synthetase ACE1